MDCDQLFIPECDQWLPNMECDQLLQKGQHSCTGMWSTIYIPTELNIGSIWNVINDVKSHFWSYTGFEFEEKKGIYETHFTRLTKQNDTSLEVSLSLI